MAAPTVTSLTPATGPYAGGTPILLVGTNLTGATAVTFGTHEATVYTVVSATQIVVDAPAHAAGAVAVEVTTPDGTSANAVQYTYTGEATPLPAFATIVDFERRYSGSVPALDTDRVEALLEDASALVREATGMDWIAGARVAVSAASNTNSITCATDPRDTDLFVGATIEIRTVATDTLVATKVITAMTATSVSWRWGDVSVTTAESVYLPVPEVVVAVCCEAVRRAYDNPQGLTGETVGNYSWRSYRDNAGEGSLYLTTAELRLVRKAGGKLGVTSANLSNDLPCAYSSEVAGW